MPEPWLGLERKIPHPWEFEKASHRMVPFEFVLEAKLKRATITAFQYKERLPSKEHCLRCIDN